LRQSTLLIETKGGMFGVSGAFLVYLVFIVRIGIVPA